MTGRESKLSNDLFFVCSLIENIGRTTKNHRSVVVNAIGIDKIQHIYNLADVYHSENIESLVDELITKYDIKLGLFDNVAVAQYSIPSFWDIGKVMSRLIISLSNYRASNEVIKILFEVYNSWICSKIEDLNSSFYFENPDYIFQSYLNGEVLV